MSLNSHKSFKSLSLFPYSLKRRHRKVGLVIMLTKSAMLRFLQGAQPSLKMRGGMTCNAKTHTQKEREGERGSGAQHSPRSLLNAGLCLCITSTFTNPRPFSKSGSAKAKYFSEMQWSPAGHSEGVRGPRSLMKHTGGGRLDKLEKTFRHH